jgi:hypothetical protein
MGLDHSIFSGVRIFIPTLATYIFSSGGVQLMAATCVAISASLLFGIRAFLVPRCGTGPLEPAGNEIEAA